MLPAFPNPVDESVTRVTAGGVVVVNVVALATGWLWLLPLIAADYAVRALTGPRFSPLAAIARRLVGRFGLPAHLAAGPPKRFAATIGAAMMFAVAVLAATGPRTLFYLVAGLMVLLPALEACAGLCIGCRLFALLIRLGVVPVAVCLQCTALTRHRPQPHDGDDGDVRSRSTPEPGSGAAMIGTTRSRWPRLSHGVDGKATRRDLASNSVRRYTRDATRARDHR